MPAPPDQQAENPAGNPVTGLVDRQIKKALEDLFGSGGSGGGDSSGSLGTKVAVLESHVQHMQSDVTEIKGLLSNLGATLHHLPTKQDMFTNVATMVIIGLTILVLAIGGIIGGLAWLQPKDAPAPVPVIVQAPTQTPAMAPAPANTAPTQKPVAPPPK